MAQVALVVELEIVPEHLDEFLGILRRHGARSVELEPGCLRFEVMAVREAPGRLILVELYADETAVEAHVNSARMAAYKERTAAMVEARRVQRCDL